MCKDSSSSTLVKRGGVPGFRSLSPSPWPILDGSYYQTGWKNCMAYCPPPLGYAENSSLYKSFNDAIYGKLFVRKQSHIPPNCI